LCFLRPPLSELPPAFRHVILLTGSSDSALHSATYQPPVAWEGAMDAALRRVLADTDSDAVSEPTRLLLWSHAQRLWSNQPDSHAAADLANAVLDFFKFPTEVEDAAGYDNAGCSTDRRRMALTVLCEAPNPTAALAKFNQDGAALGRLNCKLLDAAWKADPAALKEALDQGADPFCIVTSQWPKSALQIAAKYGSQECCELLIQAGLDPWEKNVMRSDGSGRKIESWHAEKYASENGHFELARWIRETCRPSGCLIESRHW